MKKIIPLLLLLAATAAHGQGDIFGKDSCANTPYFQTMVRASALQDAYQLIADTSLHDATIIKYSQLIIASPQGNQYPGTWITAMSYGVMAQDPDVGCQSNIYTVEHYVNIIFPMQAYAYYGVPPLPASDAARIRRSLRERGDIKPPNSTKKQ